MKNGLQNKKKLYFCSTLFIKGEPSRRHGGRITRGAAMRPVIFFCTFPEKTPKFHPDFLGNQRKLAGYFLCFVCNYLTHNKIKIFIFFLKIVVFIKICRIFASLTTNTNNKNKEQWKQQKELQKLLKEMY